MKPAALNLLTTLTALLLCTCVAIGVGAATGRQPSGGDGDLSHLVKLIGKLNGLGLHRGVATPDTWPSLGKEEDASSSEPFSTLPSSSSDNLAALRRGFLGFNKRQGAWSYDYGLGGGRFGKRYYGDYGIGGGRFGRDVDHVDVADSNDASL